MVAQGGGTKAERVGEPDTVRVRLQQAERRLREIEERYALATAVSREGIYEWDLEGGRFLLTERAKEFFALADDDLTPAAWNARIHPDDYPGYRAAIVNHFKGHAPNLEHEYRIVDAGGGFRWILDRGVGVRNANGRVTKVVGALSDITQRKLAEIEVQRARDQAEEALKQQTAMSEILRVMSRSPTDAQPVFDLVAQRAGKLCNAEVAVVARFDGKLIELAAIDGFVPEAVRIVRSLFPMEIGADAISSRVIRGSTVVHIADVLADRSYALKDFARAAQYRAGLGVPILRDRQVIGSIFVGKATPGLFSDSQVDLLKAFADQAAIAIEDVRLFKETKEALEQQTATSDILRVISRSPTDVQPVFDAIVRNAVMLCGAEHCLIFQFDGEWLRPAANYGISHGFNEYWKQNPFRPGPGTITGQAASSRRTVHVHDVLADSGYQHPEAQKMEQYRTVLSVPILREETLVGVITTWKTIVEQFTDKQVELVETFAEQAVIAFENVRLFNELGKRNRDLTEALEHQTATSEILRAISQSPTDVQPVFDTIAEAALKLCGASSALVTTFDGQLIRFAALAKLRPEGFDGVRDAFPRSAGRDTANSRAIVTGCIVEIADVLEDPEYATRAQAVAGDFRSILAVPLTREGRPLGAISVGRSEAGPFPTTQIALLKTFADQAVIAIENVRLFKELEARTLQLTRSVDELKALGDVGQAVSSTLDLETVLSTIVSRATGLAGMDGGVIYEYDESREEFHLRATDNLPEKLINVLRAGPIPKGEGALGQLAVTGEPVKVPNIVEEALYQTRVKGILIRSGYRSVLAVPLLREDHLLGGLVVIRKSAGEFAAEVIDLLKTFATQSALAIQNAQLFREVEDKSQQLEIASQHKSEFLANMSHELRTPLNAIIGFSEVLYERLFGEINEKQAEYIGDILQSGQHLLSLINDILDLSKIEAGRMELELSDFDLPSTIESTLTLVRERAVRREIALGRMVDDRLGMIRADERKVKQVLLNLLSNALKFTPEGGKIDVRAAMNDSVAEISVTDTGVGIAPEDQEAVFEEFRQVGTASKKIEGTGLGLAISRKFIELHGGKIWVTSQIGSGSTFAFTLPLR